jgi:hypothetical protein
MKIAISALVVVLLSACATCERHPVACGVVAGVVATSIALSVDHDHHGQHNSHAPLTSNTQPVNCNTGECQ